MFRTLSNRYLNSESIELLSLTLVTNQKSNSFFFKFENSLEIQCGCDSLGFMGVISEHAIQWKSILRRLLFNLKMVIYQSGPDQWETCLPHICHIFTHFFRMIIFLKFLKIFTRIGHLAFSIWLIPALHGLLQKLFRF